MKQLLIIYHSQGGNTRRMAEAVAEGALESCRELGRTMAAGLEAGIF